MRVVISGCSGGGKSALIDALAARGHRTVPEPGRRVVRAALAGEGGALPWEVPGAFAAECLRLALADMEAVGAEAEAVFFDRSGLDALLWLDALGLPLPEGADRVLAQRFDLVALAPPWPELRVVDEERRGDMAGAEAEYRALRAGYPARGHRTLVMPKTTVAARICWLGGVLGLPL
jgi:predicted ATPase